MFENVNDFNGLEDPRQAGEANLCHSLDSQTKGLKYIVDASRIMIHQHF